MRATMTAAGLAALLWTGLCLAQAGMGADFAKRREENEKALEQYTWKSKTEVQLKGKTRSVTVHQVSHDAGGQVQRTLVSEQKEDDKPGLRGHIQDKKREEFRDWAEELGALLKAYVQADAEKMQGFFKTAAFEAGAGDLEGTLRIVGKDFVQKGDEMSFWMDTTSRRPKKVEIRTTLEKDPVHLVVEFAQVADGPSYPAKAVVEAPKKEARMLVENYELNRQAP